MSNDYVRGLVDGEGCFTFHTITGKFVKVSEGKIEKLRRPVFAIAMCWRDEPLLEYVREVMGLHENLYRSSGFPGPGRENAQNKVALYSRSTSELLHNTIPFFYKKLHGFKGWQFELWLEEMGRTWMTSDSRYLHRKYKEGYFEDKMDKFP